MPKKSKYIYWVEYSSSITGQPAGGLGGFQTRGEATEAINGLNPAHNWVVVRYSASPCPICHRIDKDAVIDELGHCLFCEENQHEYDDPNSPPDQFNRVKNNS